jgi:hypothetical protein
MQFLFTRFWPTHHGLRPEGARRQHRVLSPHSFLLPLSFSAPLFLLQLALPAYPQDTRTAETQPLAEVFRSRWSCTIHPENSSLRQPW